MNPLIKTLFIIVGIFGVYATALHAEDKKPVAQVKTAPGVDRDAVMQKIFAQLKLTAEQKVKIKKVFEERHEKVQALVKDSSVAQEEKRKKYKEIVDAGNAQIVKILTPEQQVIWKKIREENSKGNRSPDEKKSK